MLASKDYYGILGVDPAATPEQIRDAFRAGMFQHHPDRNNNRPEAQEKTILLNEAYSLLSNPEQRAAYDADLRRQERAERHRKRRMEIRAQRESASAPLDAREQRRSGRRAKREQPSKPAPITPEASVRHNRKPDRKLNNRRNTSQSNVTFVMASKVEEPFRSAGPKKPVNLRQKTISPWNIAIPTIGLTLAIVIYFATRDDFPALQMKPHQSSASTATKAAPSLAETFFIQGKILDGQGHVDAAMELFHKSLALQPNNTDAHLALGNALVETTQPDDALIEYQTVVKQQPTNAEAYTAIGNVYRAKDNLPSAIDAFRKAVQFEAKTAFCHTNLGSALYADGQIAEAEAELGKAVALEPNNVQARCLYGNALWRSAKYDASIEQYRAAVAQDTTCKEAHLGLGAALYLSGQKLAAQVEWHNVLGLSQPQIDQLVHDLNTQHSSQNDPTAQVTIDSP